MAGHLVTFALLTMFLAGPFRSLAAESSPNWIVQDRTKIISHIWVPEPYKSNPSANPPIRLAIFLHGAGDRGPTTGEPPMHHNQQLPEEVQRWISASHQANYPCIVLMPQCPDPFKAIAGYDDYGDGYNATAANRNQYQWAAARWDLQPTPTYQLFSTPVSTPMSEVIKVIDEVIATYHVDTSRIYLSGGSMGGFGTWDLLMRRPGFFAAAVPMAGSGDPTQAANLISGGTKIYAMHGWEDGIVNDRGTTDMVDALVTASATVPATNQNRFWLTTAGYEAGPGTTAPAVSSTGQLQFWIIRDGGHIWMGAEGNVPGVTTWMFSQQRGSTAITPTITSAAPGGGMVGIAYTHTAAASGTAPITWSIASGALPAGLTLNASTGAITGVPTTAQTATGTLRATNAAGQTNQTFLITVTTAAVAPAITSQPANVTVTAGQTATFAVTASGTAPLTYVWKRGTTTVGGNSATLTITNAQAANAGSYTVTVSNTVGSVTSSAASLTVTTAAVAPAITSQPANITVTAGQTATFAVTTSGTAPLTYVWKRGTTTVGGNSATLSIANAQAADAGSYTVTISNTVGSVTSSSASLTVQAVVDGGGSPVNGRVSSDGGSNTCGSGLALIGLMGGLVLVQPTRRRRD